MEDYQVKSLLPAFSYKVSTWHFTLQKPMGPQQKFEKEHQNVVDDQLGD